MRLTSDRRGGDAMQTGRRRERTRTAGMGTEMTSGAPLFAIGYAGHVGCSLAQSSHRAEGYSTLLEGEREATEIPGSTLRPIATERLRSRATEVPASSTVLGRNWQSMQVRPSRLGCRDTRGT